MERSFHTQCVTFNKKISINFLFTCIVVVNSENKKYLSSLGSVNHFTKGFQSTFIGITSVHFLMKLLATIVWFS